MQLCGIAPQLGVEELLVDSLNSLLAVLLVDEDGDLDLRGGDHADVDAGHSQSLEHLGSNTGSGSHACTNDGNLCNLGVDGQILITEHLLRVAQDRLYALCIVLTDGEGNRLLVIAADGLQDDVDIDMRIP